MNISKAILFGSALIAGAFVSCKEDGPMKWVDLRYLAEDSYTLTAVSPVPIRLQVKSTDPWKVYGREPSWCSITPSEGGASELFDVTVQYTENTELDDRLDTLVIQSDYWIGKWIPVRQKGTAYLNIEGAEDLTIGQFGGTAQFSIRANQDWSLAKTEDAPWLKLIKTSGHGDAEIVLATSAENKGERRFADIAVLNRHNEKELTARVWQDGVVLSPSEARMRTTFDAQILSVEVSSNADWTVEKGDASAGWIDFPQTEFSGDGTLRIALTENTGASIRTAEVLLKTKAADGFEQIVKSIVIRQAYNPTPDYYDFDASGLEQWIINGADNDKSSCKVVGNCLEIYGAQKVHRYNCAAGNWDFFMKASSAKAQPVIYFQCGDFDMRWFVDMGAGKTNVTMVDKGKTKTFSDFNVPYSSTECHKFGIKMTPDKDGWAVFSWVLDDKVLGSYTTNGENVQTSALKYSQGLKFHIFVGAWESGGTASQTTIWSGWQYTLPYEFIDWGE